MHGVGTGILVAVIEENENLGVVGACMDLVVAMGRLLVVGREDSPWNLHGPSVEALKALEGEPLHWRHRGPSS